MLLLYLAASVTLSGAVIVVPADHDPSLFFTCSLIEVTLMVQKFLVVHEKFALIVDDKLIDVLPMFGFA